MVPLHAFDPARRIASPLLVRAVRKRGHVLGVAARDPIDLPGAVEALLRVLPQGFEQAVSRSILSVAPRDHERFVHEACERVEDISLWNCLLYTSDAADERSSVDLG